MLTLPLRVIAARRRRSLPRSLTVPSGSSPSLQDLVEGVPGAVSGRPWGGSQWGEARLRGGQLHRTPDAVVPFEPERDSRHTLPVLEEDAQLVGIVRRAGDHDAADAQLGWRPAAPWPPTWELRKEPTA